MESLRSAIVRLATAAVGWCGKDAYAIPHIRDLNDRVCQLEGNCSNLTFELKAAHDENAVLNRTVTGWRTDFAEVQTKYNSKVAELDTIRTAAAQTDSLRMAEVSRLKAELREKGSEIKSLTASYAQATDKVMELTAESAGYKTTIGALQAQSAQQAQETNLLLTSNANTNTQLSDLSGKLMAKEGECERYQATIGELEPKILAQDKLIKSLAASSTQAQTEILGLKIALDVKEMELKSTGAEVTLLRAHNEALKAECAHNKDLLASTHTKAQSEISAVTGKLTAKEGELARANSECARLNMEVSGLQGKVNNKEQQIKGLFNSNNAAQTKISVLTAGLGAKEGELTKAKAECATFKTKARDLELQVAHKDKVIKDLSDSKAVGEAEILTFTAKVSARGVGAGHPSRNTAQGAQGGEFKHTNTNINGPYIRCFCNDADGCGNPDHKAILLAIRNNPAAFYKGVIHCGHLLKGVSILDSPSFQKELSRAADEFKSAVNPNAPDFPVYMIGTLQEIAGVFMKVGKIKKTRNINRATIAKLSAFIGKNNLGTPEDVVQILRAASKAAEDVVVPQVGL